MIVDSINGEIGIFCKFRDLSRFSKFSGFGGDPHTNKQASIHAYILSNFNSMEHTNLAPAFFFRSKSRGIFPVPKMKKDESDIFGSFQN